MSDSIPLLALPLVFSKCVPLCWAPAVAGSPGLLALDFSNVTFIKYGEIVMKSYLPVAYLLSGLALCLLSLVFPLRYQATNLTC